MVCIATALFNRIVGETPSAFSTVRYVFVAGEACDPQAARKVLQAGAPEHLVNAYGPTESTGYATSYRIEAVSENARTIPIGRPISNTTAYVLDRNLQPVPAGVTGELYIGGDGLAREYWNRPELTAQRFIPDPFSGDPAGRLYRTGDFVRWLPDGNLDFLGRMDQQVKIRGFRIELEEIEATISQHPAVRISAVVARSGADGDKRLIAYLVRESGMEVSPEELRRFLRQKLPDYMLPSAFVTLESLPLTPNGKLDYAALPEPDVAAHEHAERFVEPRTAAETALAEMWKELLRVDRVGVEDNFFDLGGHSLLAIQLIARMESRFRVSVPVAALFEYPTIGQLAKLLEAESSSGAPNSSAPAQALSTRTPFFWIHGDGSDALLPDYLGADQPLYNLEHQLGDGMPAAYADVEAIAKRYIDEIRSVKPHGPYLLGGYSFGAVAAFEIAHQLTGEGEEVPLIFMLDPPGRIQQSPVQPGFRRFWRTLRSRLQPRNDGASPTPTAVDLYRQALRSYTAQPYWGRVTIVKTKEVFYAPPLDWRKLIRGPLEIAETPGAHTELTTEPRVGQWAPRLKAALDAATG